MTEFFKQGSNAFIHGKHIEACPYDPETQAARLWRRGWHHKQRLHNVKISRHQRQGWSQKPDQRPKSYIH